MRNLMHRIQRAFYSPESALARWSLSNIKSSFRYLRTMKRNGEGRVERIAFVIIEATYYTNTWYVLPLDWRVTLCSWRWPDLYYSVGRESMTRHERKMQREAEARANPDTDEYDVFSTMGPYS